MPEESSVHMPQLTTNSPAGLAGEYLRSFSEATRQIGDFDAFYDVLRELIGQDAYLAGAAEIEDSSNSPPPVPDFENLDPAETVIAVNGPEGSQGFLKYRGRCDGGSFGADDLHLMGAIAGFVSALTAQAQNFKKKGESIRVFQYLINQLPLGVVCFDAEGGLLVENKLAQRLLGEAGAALVRGALSEKALKDQGKLRMHLEVENKLLYAEGRRLDVDETLSVHAFVLHDMSGQREKHLLQLERSVFRAESRGAPLTVAILEDRSEAGRLLRILKANADALQLNPDEILAFDAYTCVCVFAGKRLRGVRYLLKNGLPRTLDRGSAKGAFVAEWDDVDEDTPVQSLIDGASRSMRALEEVFRPTLLVLDAFPAVLQSLEWIGGEIASFEAVVDSAAAVEWIESGRYDGIFVDIDAFSAGGLEWLELASPKAGGGFAVFYVSHKQASMVYTAYGLGEEAVVLQKPFDAQKLEATLALQFEFV